MMARIVVVSVLSLAGAAAAADLGRMFFTPEQRAALDKSRTQNVRPEPVREIKPPLAPLPQNVSVTGVIRRSDGKHTIWLNNHVVDGQAPDGIKAGMGKRDDQVRLRVPDSKRSVDLKVGQTLEIVSGTIEENYARRVPAKPAGAAAAGQNDAVDASKVITARPAETVTSESLAQKRPARAAEGDDAEAFPPRRRMEAK